jgi:AcrR family transcriptional regulator
MSAKAKPKSRQRVSLSRGIILDAAFRIVDGGVDDVTMSKLGAELGADPSAVYRHFRNKDELLLAMADVMLEESMNSYIEGDDPIENLRRMALTLRRSYLRRPGLSRWVASRFTGGAAEEASVRHMLGDAQALGYDEQQSIDRIRALAEMTLGHIQLTAEVLALPRKAQAFELEMQRSYYVRPRETGPKLTAEEQREAHLVDGEAVFITMLETFLTGLKASAPKKR